MFADIKRKVQSAFNSFDEKDLFVVDLDKNELYDAYVNAYPEEDRQPHSCNNCRMFLNNFGNVVAIRDNKIHTLWDFELDAPYDQIPKVLHQLVSNAPIKHGFVAESRKMGIDLNRQRFTDGTILVWEHFYTELKSNKFVKPATRIPSIIGEQRTVKQVFERAMNTITMDAATTVMSLIEANSLYRGLEFKGLIQTFIKQKQLFESLSNSEKDCFLWLNYTDGGRIRNTAIGTLLVDLSEGRDLESAVKAYETVVAPANYKRSTSLITPKMIEAAEETIRELGLTDALARRHATASDVSVSDVLFVNRDTKGSVFDELTADVVVKPSAYARVEEMPIDQFIKEILPSSDKVEVLVENSHKGKFASLIAPANPEAPGLFKWSNNMSWTYSNNLTDSIAEKVKNAGGNVNGILRVSLEWFNYDDLDLHVIEPDGNRIHYARKASPYGALDVDMNAGTGKTREAVENIIFTNPKLLEGKYQVLVHNFSKRENIDVGFNIEIECMGEIINLSHDRAVPSNAFQKVITFNFDRKLGITDRNIDIADVAVSKDVFGVSTNKFQKVKMICNSPNYFEGNAIGNPHVFFILEGAKVDVPVNGFFNEYLRQDLNEHRKVFEVLGNKLKVNPTDDQLSGLGFSLTQRDSIVCKVSGKTNRVIKVKF